MSAPDPSHEVEPATRSLQVSPLDIDDYPDRATRLARFKARRAAAPPLTADDEALIAELLAGADERLARFGIFPIEGSASQ
ncbi:MAG: hypothetical protein R2761_31710 [Acidimicrobiales bacterium]